MALNDRKHMDTLVARLEQLRRSGFEKQFKVTKKGLQSLATQNVFGPEQIKIAHFYRFEGESSPSDSSILFAIETFDGEKGTLVDAYGNEGDILITEFIQKVQEIHK